MKTIAKIITVLLLVNPWYARAELDLTIPPEESTVAWKESDLSSDTSMLAMHSSGSMEQNNFRVGGGKASPVVVVAVAIVVALVALSIANEADK